MDLNILFGIFEIISSIWNWDIVFASMTILKTKNKDIILHRTSVIFSIDLW